MKDDVSLKVADPAIPEGFVEASPPLMDQRPPLTAFLNLRDDTAMPLYQQLEQQLERLIENGTLGPGTTLPAERQMAQSLGVSRLTVQRSYDGLRRRKLLSAHGRLGYIVQGGGRLHSGMDRLKGFTEEMHELGRVPSADVLERSVLYDRSIASIFGLPSTAPLLKVVRVRRGDGVPLSHENAWYNLVAAPSIVSCDGSGSIYAFLDEVCGLPLLYCDQTIEAAQPTDQECSLFGFVEPVPCLLIKRRSYVAGNVVIEYVEGLFRGDLYSYRLRLNV